MTITEETREESQKTSGVPYFEEAFGAGLISSHFPMEAFSRHPGSETATK